MVVALRCLLAAGGYLLGSFPTASLVAGRRGVDPTSSGSGNPGATNVYRLAGRRAGLLVLAGDLAKGVVASAAGLALAGRPGAFAAGAGAVVGHCFPARRRRRGGKGVATAAGLAVVVLPIASVAALAAWTVVAAASRRVSLASLVAIVAVPVGAVVTGRPSWEVTVAAAIAALVIVRHRANIVRLVRGEERAIR